MVRYVVRILATSANRIARMLFVEEKPGDFAISTVLVTARFGAQMFKCSMIFFAVKKSS